MIHAIWLCRIKSWTEHLKCFSVSNRRSPFFGVKFQRTDKTWKLSRLKFRLFFRLKVHCVKTQTETGRQCSWSTGKSSVYARPKHSTVNSRTEIMINDFAVKIATPKTYNCLTDYHVQLTLTRPDWTNLDQSKNPKLNQTELNKHSSNQSSSYRQYSVHAVNTEPVLPLPVEI